MEVSWAYIFMLPHNFWNLPFTCFLRISFLTFSTCSHTFNNSSLFNVAFRCLPSRCSFICLNCLFFRLLFIFNSYFQSHFLLHLTAFITLNWFCLEYFVRDNCEHCKVSCHLGARGGETVLRSICCLAICFSGAFSCKELRSKLKRQAREKVKMGLKNTAITAQHLLQHLWSLHDSEETPVILYALCAIMYERLNSFC